MSSAPIDDEQTTRDDAQPESGAITHHGDVPHESAEPHYDRLSALIESEAPAEEIARELEASEPADAADTLEELEGTGAVAVIQRMDDEAAADALSHMELPLAATVLPQLATDEAARYIDLMDPDDAADLLQTLNRDQVDRLLQALPRRTAAILGKLVLYHPETAGGLMTTEFFKLRSRLTVTDALQYLRLRRGDLADSDLYSMYCLDDQDRLEGVLDLRSLLVAQPDQPISQLMDRDIDALRPDLDREEVARAFDRYNFVMLPVVDEAKRVLGVVTIDDVIDIIRAENTEDALKQVGVGVAESVYAPLGQKLKGRLPWLLVNLLTSQLGALIVFMFTDLIHSIAFLAVLMGMIANQAGNTGQQSLAVTLRGLVLGEVRAHRVAQLVFREILVGVFSGVVTGALIAIAIIVANQLGVVQADWTLGVVAGLAMCCALIIGCLVGTSMPLIMNRLGFDPATASTIFLTMITDTTSFASLLGLAWIFRQWLLAGAPTPTG